MRTTILILMTVAHRAAVSMRAEGFIGVSEVHLIFLPKCIHVYAITMLYFSYVDKEYSPPSIPLSPHFR